MFTFDGEMVRPDDLDFRRQILESYYKSEYRSLYSQVEQGTLSLQKALSGELFVLPMDTDPYAVAVIINGIVIRSGDIVELRRDSGGQTESLLTPVGGFRLNEHSSEIDFTPREHSLTLKLDDVKSNASAASRALLYFASQRTTGRVLSLTPGLYSASDRLQLMRA